MRSHLKTFLIAVVTLALIAWFLRQADFAQVWLEIRTAQVGALVLMLAVTALTYVLRAARWVCLLRPLGAVHFNQAFRTTVMGFAANTVLPARIGEFLRPYLLARRERLSVSATFATIILERLLDLVAVLMLFGLFVFAFDPGMASTDGALYATVKAGGLMAAAGAVVALVMVALLASAPVSVSRAIDRVSRVLPDTLARRVSHTAHMFVRGLSVSRDPRGLLEAVAWSLPLWLSIAAGIWLVTVAFRMTIPFTGSFLIVALLVVGVSVPTPGAVGGFHEAFRLGATVFFGVANDRAVGAAIVLHALSFLPVVLVGAVFMVQDGLNLNRVRALGEEARHQEEEAEAEAEAAPPASVPAGGREG